MPSIDDIYGTVAPPRPYRVPEVVTPSPAVPPGNALAVFRADPAGLMASTLAILDIKVKPVETPEAASDLADKVAQACLVLKNIEARRKQIVEPIKREASSVDATAKAWREPVEAWVKQADRVLLAYKQMAEDKARRAEEARQEQIREAAKKQREAEILGNVAAVEEASTAIMHLEAAPPVQELKGFKTESGSVTTRQRWKVEVVAPELVPPAYLLPDLRKLQAAVDAGAREIEGCNVFLDESLTHRTRG